jgi:hypothetical protein
MDRDRLSASLLRILYLRWSAIGRTRRQDAATVSEIAACIDADRWLIHDLLADLSTVGLVERVTVHDRGEHAGYRISSGGRHIVLTDRSTQRRFGRDV